VRVVGHRDVPGRPALYATTRKFLDYFGLRSLADLPTLAEIRDPELLGDDLPLETPEQPGVNLPLPMQEPVGVLLPEPPQLGEDQ